MTILPLDEIRTDGGTQSRAVIDLDTVRDYAEQMMNGVTFPAITVYYDGADYWLSDGFHRVRAAYQAELTEIAADVRQGTIEDARWHSYSVNQNHGLRRSNEDKKRAIEAALQHPYAATKSSTEIGRHCGVDHKTVIKYKDILGISQDTRLVTRNGSQYEMHTASIGTHPAAPRTDSYAAAPLPFDTPTVGAAAANDDQPAAPVEDTDESDWYADDTDEQPNELPVTPARPAIHQLLTSSESNEWYTPAAYVNAAREVMGAIDLDPASNALANATVQAAQYFTIEDDGYTQLWGREEAPVRVWLNPPYGKVNGESNAARWSRKLLDAYRAGNVSEAVLLVNASTGDGWFAPLKQFAVCFPDSRIRFFSPEGATNQPTHSNALVYFGPNVASFVKVFSQFGTVMGRLMAHHGRVVSAGLGASL